jgi:hypothetical protein
LFHCDRSEDVDIAICDRIESVRNEGGDFAGNKNAKAFNIFQNRLAHQMYQLQSWQSENLLPAESSLPLSGHVLLTKPTDVKSLILRFVENLDICNDRRQRQTKGGK